MEFKKLSEIFFWIILNAFYFSSSAYFLISDTLGVVPWAPAARGHLPLDTALAHFPL